MADKSQPKGAKRAGPAAPRQQMKKAVGLAAPTSKNADASNGELDDATLMARPYHHGNLRKDLVRCRKQQLDEVGMDGLSLRRIASKVGVSQVATLHHFGYKEGLPAASVTLQSFAFRSSALICRRSNVFVRNCRHM